MTHVGGDSTLTLDVTPTNWDVGHRLVLTGTSSNHRNTQDEELEIVSIDGNVVTIDADSDEPGIQPLKYNHLTPDGYDLSVYVANVNRNVVIMSENPAITQQTRPCDVHAQSAVAGSQRRLLRPGPN